MNKKTLITASITGIAIGILVFHPLWVSLHAFDGLHDNDNSWLDFVLQAYQEVFSFNDIKHLLLSVFSGIVVSIFVLMIKDQKKRKKDQEGKKSNP